MVSNKYHSVLIFAILNTVINLLLNLLIPYKIDFAFYGDYRYIATLLSFSGLFHLGYLDGFYLNNVLAKPISKLSLPYLFFIVSITFILASSFFFFFDISLQIPVLVYFFLILITSLNNALGMIHYLKGNFVYPLLTQLAASFLLLMIILNDFIAQYAKQHIYTIVILFYVIQLVILSIFSNREYLKNSIQFKTNSIEILKRNHNKGIKILIIGLSGVLILGLDKMLLYPILSDSNFGMYCFANSFLISLVGLSMSVSTKLVKDFSQYRVQALNKNYNQLVQYSMIIAALMLTALYLVIPKMLSMFPHYFFALQLLPLVLSAFPLLFIVLVLYSNLSKVYGFEKPFLLLTSIIVFCIYSLILLFQDNITNFLLIYPICLAACILLFDKRIVKKRAGVQLSTGNQILFLVFVLLSILPSIL